MKNLITIITLSSALVTSVAFARPDFAGHNAGHNMKNISQGERVERITQRLTEQGLSQDQIQARLATMQERMDSHEDRMQHSGDMEDRMATIHERMDSHQGRMQHSGNMEDRMENMQEHMQTNGASQEDIQARMDKIQSRMENK